MLLVRMSCSTTPLFRYPVMMWDCRLRPPHADGSVMFRTKAKRAWKVDRPKRELEIAPPCWTSCWSVVQLATSLIENID